MTGRIVIAGGDPGFRIGLRARLAAACHDAAQARNSEEALAIARDSPPDVVIAIEDRNDPGAAKLCAALRHDPRARHSGIVALVGETGRLAALRAGADDALSHPVDELLLLARIRRLTNTPRQDHTQPAAMMEGAAGFAHRPRIVLIGEDAAMAIGWRHALAPHLPAQIDSASPAEALLNAAQGKGADLYLIASDLAQGGDGLRLLSELRTRPACHHSAFIIAMAPLRAAMAPIALDLGAGDVLPVSLREGDIAEEAAFRITAQLAERNRMLAQHRDDERHRIWAMTDPLTGLFNRRHALPRFEEMLAAAIQNRQVMSVMIIDLDRFKTVNDRFGHAAGDAVLAQIARRLKQGTAPGTLLARLGGEEFLLIDHDTTAGDAVAFAETLRQSIAASPIMLPRTAGGGELWVTASIGLAVTERQELAHSATAREPLTTETLMARADLALLDAKSRGRNRVLLATRENAL